MTTREHLRQTIRIARDFAVGLILFLAAVALIELTTQPASSFPLLAFGDMPGPGATPAYEAWSRQVWVALFAPAQETHSLSMLVLALAFATTTAFNLGLLRHLRRVYASPRPGVWRRG